MNSSNLQPPASREFRGARLRGAHHGSTAAPERGCPSRSTSEHRAPSTFNAWQSDAAAAAGTAALRSPTSLLAHLECALLRSLRAVNLELGCWSFSGGWKLGVGGSSRE